MSATAKVGAFFVLALLIAAWFVLRLQNFRLGESGSEYVVHLPEAQGLPEKAPVLVRGIRIGRVTDLDLVNNQVRAKIVLRPDVSLREGATARIASIGFLGEKQLELSQGPENAPALPPGSVIQGQASIDVDALVQTADEVSEDVSAITRATRDAMVGPGDENRVDEALTGFVALTKELRALTSSLNRVVERFDRATRPTTAGSQRSVDPAGIGGSGTEQPVDPIAQSVQDTREASASLRRAAQELEALVQSIRRGEGTLGRLVTDTETVDRLDETLASINQTVGFASGLETRLGFRADYRFEEDRAESYVTLELRPSPGSFLRLQGIGTGGAFTASALLGRRFDPVVLRMGLIRAHPGLGGDLLLLGDRFRLTAELWNFERIGGPPHARLESAVYPLDGLFLVGGWDDLLTRGRGTDAFFLGAGFDFGR